MSRTPTDLVTHLVRWQELKPAFDNKSFFLAEHRGIVLTQLYTEGRFVCLVVDANGKLWTKDVSSLTMVYPPLSHPRNGHTTQSTLQPATNTKQTSPSP